MSLNDMDLDWCERISGASTRGHAFAHLSWVSELDQLMCEVCVSASLDSPTARRADRSPQGCAGCGRSTPDPVLVDAELGEITAVVWLCPACLAEARR